MADPRWLCWFDDLSLRDVALVGGKNASLGEMRRSLVPLGIRVPDGFATTAAAYRLFLSEAGLEKMIRKELTGLDPARIDQLQRSGERIRSAILAAELPRGLSDALQEAYRQLEQQYGEGCAVAVRSSATAEDLPEASFAGQLESYLNIRGTTMLLDAVRRCAASLFTDRAIVYRAERGVTDSELALSVGVQHMVRSDLAGAGVIFTLDTESGFRDVVLISAAYGLGESVVQGSVNPDEYLVHKPTLLQGYRPVIQRRLGSKEFKVVYEEGGSRPTRTVPVAQRERRRFVLAEDEILLLARWACQVEEHYSQLYGRPTPMDLEWAKDGRSGELFLVQSRPETVHARHAGVVLERHHLDEKGELLATGRSVGEKIGIGRAHLIRSLEALEELREGEILVTEMTDPDWEPVMRRAAGVVTDRGGRTCHAAIVSRELGIPALVGTDRGTETIPGGEEVTLSCAEGEEGHVYRGRLRTHVERVDLAALRTPRTEVMLNLGDPAQAFSLSFLPNAGVGLARLEFIIGSQIRVHPMALLYPERITDRQQARTIEELIEGYSDPARYFIERLAEGVAMIAAAFWPKPVIVRHSDFKSNEYADLLGGHAFEPEEHNPMLGLRGASRYYDPTYRDAFHLECAAMRRVREEMGLHNVILMIPFCRTPEEAERVLSEMASQGLVRGENDLQVYIMCEIPSNVILAHEFARYIDGFSIGSNDLTQLVLGVDRDSERLASLFDERNPAVTRFLSQMIASSRSEHRKIGICGQAPSDFPELVTFLVEQGIDSISVNADALLSTTLRVLEVEDALANAPRESR